MRRVCLVAALAAGSMVVHAQVGPCTPSSPTPCISSLQSGLSGYLNGNIPPPAHGAAITAGTGIGDFWLYINGNFNGDAATTVTWTSLAAPGVVQLQLLNQPTGTSLLVADVPASLFTSQDSATVVVTQQSCFELGCNVTMSSGLIFTVNPPMTALALPEGAVGQPYSQPLASGGTGPYTITYEAEISGPLPPGMTGSYEADPNTNFSGTPTTLGIYTFNMLILDAWENRIVHNYSLTIATPPAISSLVPPGCTVSTNSTAGCTTGALPLQVAGVNFTAGLSVLWDGTPIGGTVNGATSITAPVPHNLLTVGTHQVSLRLAGFTSNSVPFVVFPAPVLTSLQPSSAPAGSPAFAMALNGANYLSGMIVQWQGPSGGAVLVPFAVTANQLTVSVPANLLAGSGTAAVAVLSADAVPVASSSLPFVITPPVRPPLAITTASPLAPATAGTAYSNVLTATGGDPTEYYFSLAGGALPSAIILSSDGRLSGIPATTGSYTFVVQVTDDFNDVATKTFNLVVNLAPLIITTPQFAAMPVGTSFSATFTAQGGTPPYTFSSSGTLPPNAQFTSGGGLTATLNTPGTFAFTVTVTDSAKNTASQGYTIVVRGTALAIATTSPLAAGQAGVAYPEVQFQAAGGLPPYAWSAGAVPPGMSFSASGALSGTPTAAGNYSISVTVTDSAKAIASGSFAIAIGGVTITTASLPNGTVGTPYSAPNMGATGGAPPYTWSATGLPAGIALSAAGAFSGTPAAPGAASVTITVTDSQGNKASQSYTVTVIAAPLSIALAGTVPTVTVGSSFSVGFTAAGGVPPYSYSVTGLPAGSISSGTGGTGSISGTLAAPGGFTVTVTVKDSAGTTASTSFSGNATLPVTPPFNFTGPSTTANPGSQSSVGVGIGSAYPVDVTVKLALTFTGTDPAVQFASGGTTASLTVPAGQLASLTTVGIQTGTVAGTITITAQLLASGVDVTPSPAPTRVITIPSTAPVITSISAARNSSGFTVTIIGYSSPRALSAANFTFNGTNLGTTTVSIPVSTVFASWYQSSASGQYGSNFSYTQPFTTSNPQAVTSVTVTLVNNAGTSAAATANLQ